MEIKFPEKWNRKPCTCEYNDSFYSHPLNSFFEESEIKKINLVSEPENYQVIRCRNCKGITVIEQPNFEPSIYDLPKYLFTLTFSLCSESKDKSLKAFARAASKADFLKLRNVRKLKMEQLNKNLADYGIKWE